MKLNEILLALTLGASTGSSLANEELNLQMLQGPSGKLLITVSQTHDGSANAIFVNIGTYLSNDGRLAKSAIRPA